jgi:hypothetical protein
LLCNIPLVHAGTNTIDTSNSPTGDVVPPPGGPNVVNILEGAVVTGNVFGSSEPVIDNTINVSGGSIAGDVIGGLYGGTIVGSNNVNVSGGAIGSSVYGSRIDESKNGHISDSTKVHVSGGTIGAGVYGAYTPA